MRQFPPSFGKWYILIAINYVSKWVEAVAIEKNDAKTVVKFVHKNILTRFGPPDAFSVMKGVISII